MMNASHRVVTAILPLLPISLLLCSIAGAQPMPLKDVHTWMYHTAKLHSRRAGRNHPLAFRDQRRQDIAITGPHSMLKQILAEGYDGLYLDSIQLYEDPAIIEEAKKQNIDPAQAMSDLLTLVHDEARKINP